MEHGQLDLVLHDDGFQFYFPPERLYREIGFAPGRVAAALATGCRLSSTWQRATSLSLRMPVCGRSRQLTAVGAERVRVFELPYFGVALQCLPGTELLLTLTTGMTSVVRRNCELRLATAPHELHRFHFLRHGIQDLNADPRHV